MSVDFVRTARARREIRRACAMAVTARAMAVRWVGRRILVDEAVSAVDRLREQADPRRVDDVADRLVGLSEQGRRTVWYGVPTTDGQDPGMVQLRWPGPPDSGGGRDLDVVLWCWEWEVLSQLVVLLGGAP